MTFAATANAFYTKVRTGVADVCSDTLILIRSRLPLVSTRRHAQSFPVDYADTGHLDPILALEAARTYGD